MRKLNADRADKQGETVYYLSGGSMTGATGVLRSENIRKGLDHSKDGERIQFFFGNTDPGLGNAIMGDQEMRRILVEQGYDVSISNEAARIGPALPAGALEKLSKDDSAIVAENFALVGSAI